ncbi:MAG: xylose isomerase protein [Clostridia bacterium]|nr:xylose isomerase protein [Clostridia bacterium]
MNIGISSYTYSWGVGVNGYPQPLKPYDAFALLQKAVDLKVDALQIADNFPLHSLESVELDMLGEMAEKSNICLEVGTKGLNTENLFKYLNIAKKLKSRIVRTLPHDSSNKPSLSEAIALVKSVVPVFEKEGIILAIENHDYYNAEWLKKLVCAADSPAVGICLDAVNNLGQGEGFNEVFNILSDYTVNFHCKDYTIKRKKSMLGFDVEGCPVGKGFFTDQ